MLRVVPQTIFIPRESGNTLVRLHYSQQLMPGQLDNVIVVFPEGSHITISDIGIAH